MFLIFGSLILATLCAWFFLSRPNDAEIMVLTLRNIAKLETFEYHSAVSIAANRSVAQVLPLFDTVLYSKGVFAMGGDTRPNLTNKFEARLYFPDGRYQFRGDFVRADGATYMQLRELPSFGLINVADVVGTWFTVPALWDTGPVSREIRPLAGLLGERSLFQSVTRLADDEIDGRAVYHVQATVASDAFTEFARTAILGQGGSVAEAERAIVFVRERLRIETIDLWITKRGFDVYRIRTLARATPDAFAPVHIIASVDLRRHNHSLLVHVPVTSAPSIETVLSPIGASLGVRGFETNTLTSQLPEVPPVGATRLPLGGLSVFRQDTDRDGLSNLMEQVYGSDPLNPDSDADAYSDGSEVDRGYDPMGPGTLR